MIDPTVLSDIYLGRSEIDDGRACCWLHELENPAAASAGAIVVIETDIALRLGHVTEHVALDCGVLVRMQLLPGTINDYRVALRRATGQQTAPRPAIPDRIATRAEAEATWLPIVACDLTWITRTGGRTSGLPGVWEEDRDPVDEEEVLAGDGRGFIRARIDRVHADGRIDRVHADGRIDLTVPEFTRPAGNESTQQRPAPDDAPEPAPEGS